MMNKKAKKFSHKLLALFLAVVMGLTCFSGVISAQAAQDTSSTVKYHDEYVEYNNLAWKVLSDEQTATAILDYLDLLLADVGPGLTNTIGKAITGLNVSVLKWNASNRQIKLSAVIANATIDVHLYSVNEVLHTIQSAGGAISNLSSYIGDAKNIKLDTTSNITRENTSSVDILRRLVGLLSRNSADYAGKDVIGQLLRGGFHLGTVGSLANIDIYEILGNAFGMTTAEAKDDLVYNLVKHILMSNTNWFTDEEKALYADNANFEYDAVLLEKMRDELFSKINAEITYRGVGNSTESSRNHYKAITEKVASTPGMTFRQAAADLGYDPDLVYTSDGNVYLFVYGTDATTTDCRAASDAQRVSITKDSSLFEFGYQALSVAWKTALEPTLFTLRVNYDVDRGHSTNFDNAYYSWAITDGGITWDQNNLAAMYSDDNIDAWANAKYVAYGAQSKAEFLGWVKDNFQFDRDAKQGSTGSWSDIEANELFNELRYSPLVDYYFARHDETMKTGPINLYFMQTGAPHLDAFFNNEKTYTQTTYENYSSLVAGLNDALVAAVYDLFMDSASHNIYGDVQFPTLQTTGNFDISEANLKNTASVLVSNAAAMIQYTADSANENILKAFHDNSATLGTTLNETNLETAMLPLLISCVGQINLNGFDMREYVHPEDWNACKDAEGVAYLALKEYLSYILPNKDYSVLATRDDDGKLEVTLKNTLLPMARDAIVYVMQGYVPVTDKNGNNYDVYTRPVTDSTELFDILNSVICFYGGEYTFSNENVKYAKGAMAVGALLGVCDDNGNCTLSMTNSQDSNKTNLWNNINAIANHLFPVLGQLYYNDENMRGQIDSETLIWSDIVEGMLQISDVKSTGLQGVGNFVFRFLTIVSATPISETPITLTIYDVLADFVNALFGNRMSSRATHESQDWVHVAPLRSSMPAANQSAPWDYILHKAQLAGTDGTQVGIIQKALCNFAEATGFGCNNSAGDGMSTTKYSDSVVRGLMFAVNAVQTFVPNILGSIGDHSLQAASIEYSDAEVSNCTSGTSYSSSLIFKNNSIGVNNAYVKDGAVTQLDRYYMKITGVNAVASDGSTASISGWNSLGLIAPQAEVSLTTSSKYQDTDGDSSTSVRAVVTYDIYDGNDTTKQPIHTGLKTYAYQYLTTKQSWQDIVYPVRTDGSAVPDGNLWISTKLETVNQGSSVTSQGYKTYTSKGFAPKKVFASTIQRLSVLYPEYMVISTTNLSEIDKFQFRMNRKSSSYDASIDGFYCYEDSSVSVWNDGSNSNVSLGMNYAIPCFDPETGDILKYGRYDALISKVTSTSNGVDTITYYDQDNNVLGTTTSAMTSEQIKTATAEFWDRGTVWGHYYDALDEGTGAKGINKIISEHSSDDGWSVSIRTHHAYTLTEALNYGMVRAYHMDSDSGVYEYVYLQSSSNSSYQYNTTLGQISMRGPVNGIYLAQGNTTVNSNTKYTTDLFKYDETTPIQAGSYPVKLCFYNSSGSGSIDNGSCTLVVGDTANAGSLGDSADAIIDILNDYRDSDYKDGGLATQTKAFDAIAASLDAKTAVLTPTSASTFSDKTQLMATVNVVATEYGDMAYKPFAAAETTGAVTWNDANDGVTDLPKSVFADAYTGDGTKGVNNILYFDEACTMPIYSNVRATVANGGVIGSGTNVTDAAGKALIEGKNNDAGSFWLKNAPSYKTEWTESTSTYLAVSDGLNKPIHWRTIVKENGVPVQDTNAKGDKLYEQIQYVYRNMYGDKVNSDFAWACKFPVTTYQCIPNQSTPYDTTKTPVASNGDYRGNITKMADELAWILEQLKDAINPSLAESLYTDVSQMRQGMNNNNFNTISYNKMTEVAQKAEKQYKVVIDYNKNVPDEDENGNQITYADPVFDEETGELIHNAGDVVMVNKNFVDKVSFKDVQGYLDNKDNTINSITTETSMSSVLVAEYTRLYNVYATAVIERGYIGDKLEAEIACAAGNAYTAFAGTTPAVYDENGEITTDAVVRTSATTVPFGAVKNGVLVNEGPTIYASGLWNNYVRQLANCVDIATRGNGDYAYKNAANYVPTRVEGGVTVSNSDAYTCQVTDCYSSETALQVAELQLENAVLLTVDPSVVGGTVSINGEVVDRTKPFGVWKNSWLTLDGVADEGYTFTGFDAATIGDGEGKIVVGENDQQITTYNTWIKNTNTVLVPVFTAEGGSSDYNVNSSLVVAKNNVGDTDNVAVNGDYTITVYNGDEVVYTLDKALSFDDNTFALVLPAGTYTATIESEYAFTRDDITITVTDADIEADAIVIVCCNFNGDEYITAVDAVMVYTESAGEGAAYCNLNGDEYVTALDALIVYNCASGEIELDPVTIA